MWKSPVRARKICTPGSCDVRGPVPVAGGLLLCLAVGDRLYSRTIPFPGREIAMKVSQMAAGENAGTKPANALSDFLARTHRALAADDSGAVADYIPELLKADPKHFGIALATTD